MRKLSYFFTILAALLIPNISHAIPLEIIDSPQHIGGFTHNVFHVAVNGGGSGSILAWYDLNNASNNRYDPDTGDLQATFNIFNNSSFDVLWGSVIATGNLPGAAFGDNDGSIAGSINWDFSFDVVNPFASYLDGKNNIETNFKDKHFTTTSLGTSVNSWDDPYLSLWGASGVINPEIYDYCADKYTSGTSDYNTCVINKKKYLGTDLVLETGQPVVPEPGTISLMVSGLAGAFGLRRKRA